MALTENGAISLDTTMDARLNLFFKTVRDLGNFMEAIPFELNRNNNSKITVKNNDYYSDDLSSEYDIVISNTKNDYLFSLIEESWSVDKLDTMKILMNWRDCRGGKGDYSGFIVAMAYLWEKYPKWMEVNYEIIPEYGCWLDLIKLWHICPNAKTEIMDFIVNKLIDDLSYCGSGNNVSLLAKWFPSENSKWDRFTKDRFCIAFCKALLNVKYVSHDDLKLMRTQYIVPLRKYISLVETKLCEKNYSDIDYEKVPSVAMNKYKKTFIKRDGERFEEYLTKVKQGSAKINSDQVYPHDLVRQYLDCGSVEDHVIEAQWKNIKTKVHETGAFDRSISVVDVSGSMSGTPMEVAIALGLLGLCDSNKNRVITFTATPKLYKIEEGSLFSQVNQLKNMEWGMNTDFERVMDLVFGMVVGGNDIDRIYIFSDMQFDQAVSNSSTHFERIKEKFENIGVNIPQIVFWNLRGETKDFPVKCNDIGTILLSGYSPSLLTSIIDRDEITPLDMMFKIIRGKRYDLVKEPLY